MLSIAALSPSLAGCGDDRPATSEAVAVARARAADVGAFERWAARIAASDTSFADRAALEEAAFAPVRGDDHVAGAWIERRGPDPHLLAHPRRARVPDDLAWRRVRAEGLLGEAEVARTEERDYVRRTISTTGGAALIVTIAFVRAPEAS